MLKLLYLGDIVSTAGQQVVQKVLPSLIKEHAIDGVIAQAENVSHGRGMTLKDLRFLQNTGIDGFTGGNWSAYQSELIPVLNDVRQPVVGLANYTNETLPGYKYIQLKNKKTILVISLLGQVVSRLNQTPSNPLFAADEILQKNKTKVAAIIVNLHGDFSSEKKTFGYYLDGRVSLVVGDHWHIPTADAMVLPQKTAHITDVGMCGSLHSSLGVDLKTVIRRWYDQKPSSNVWDENLPWQFNAVLVTVNQDGLAEDIQPIQKIIKSF